MGAERTQESGEFPGSTRSDLLFSCNTEGSAASDPRTTVQPRFPRSVDDRNNGVPAWSSAASSREDTKRITAVGIPSSCIQYTRPGHRGAIGVGHARILRSLQAIG